MAFIETANFPELLTKKHKKCFQDEYNNWQPIYEKIFKVEMTDQKVTTMTGITGMGLATAGTEGQLIALQEFVDTPTRSFTQVRYENGYKITAEMMMYDQYKTRLISGFGYNGSAQGLAKSFREKEERMAASVLSNGFTVNGYDGVPLFSNAHPLYNAGVATCDNLLTGSLSDAKLEEALILSKAQLDESGLKIMTRPNKLVVNTSNEYNAYRILDSVLRSGTSNNDKNVLPNLEVVVNPYLATEAEWYLIDTNIENLMFLWAQKPKFEEQKIVQSIDKIFFGTAFFSVGYVNWRGTVGSLGLNA